MNVTQALQNCRITASSYKIKTIYPRLLWKASTVDIDIFDRWNGPKPAHPNMTHHAETLYKQEVPSGFKLSTGWLNDKAKNPDSQYRETVGFKLMKQHSLRWFLTLHQHVNKKCSDKCSATFSITYLSVSTRLWFYGLQRI